MIPKENDMLLNMLANPQFTVTDFQSVGLTGDNTNLLSEDKYKASDKIRNHEFFQDDNGNFDEAKFHDFYVGAGYFYNQLTTQNYDQEVLDSALYSQDNIWVEPEKRKIDYTPKLTRQANENLVTSSLDSVGKRGLRTMSISEIAQTQQIYDIKTGEWKDSPNDSFFDNFFNTLVLATWDEDGEHLDKETGQMVKHSKGQYKLNDAGTYYYETLGGRDVYGKQVLNKMNILTTDGSVANKFDFFDSDDIDQKSIGGTVLKNAALVGSMFLPYVGPAIRGLSVLTQMAGLTATLGKLFVGNENETLNNIQGWAKTVNRSSQTEYAAQNTWCTENFLNMIGDTVGQLAEQRWIFKNAPYIMGNTKAVKAMSKKGAEALKKEKLTDLNKDFKVKDLMGEIAASKHPEKKGMQDYIAGMNMLNERKALSYVDKLTEQAQKISSPLAKAYMTGLTVQDTYGEAKAAGASDMEAALLTIGYAAGEAAILNTGLGEWILPELQGTKFKMRAIANALTKEVREANEKYVKDKSKRGLVQKLLDTGKKIATNQYAEAALSGKKGLQVVGAHALGEAFEETSEELLADLSKSIFNVTRWLRGEEALELGAWEGAGDRYLMSALGGFIGGGLTSAGTDFSVANSLGKMDKTKAMQELIYLVNNGQEKEFLNQVNKMNLGNKNLSAQDIIESTKDNVVWGEAKQGDNQDLAVKKLLHNEVNFIKNVLEAEGAKISTESLLNKLTLEDQETVLQEFRLNKLQNTQSMGLYLQNFQNLQNDLVTTHAQLAELNSTTIDSEDESEEVKGKRSQLTQKLKDTQGKIQQYLSGNMVPEAIRDSLYEMNPLLSNNLIKIALPFYAQKMYGKKWNELSDAEKEEATKRHKEYMDTSAKNDIHSASGFYYDMIELFTPFATQAQDYIKNLQKDEFKNVKALQDTMQNLLQYLNNKDFNAENFDADQYIGEVQGLFDSLGQTTAEVTAIPLIPEQVQQQLEVIKTELAAIEQQSIDDTFTEDVRKKEIRKKTAEYTRTLQNSVLDIVDAQVQPFIKLGHANPEVKQALLTALDTTQAFAQNARDNIWRTVDSMNLNNPTQERLITQQLETKYDSDIEAIKENKKLVKQLTHTPILQYLDQFRLSTTNSDLNLTKHWENTKAIFTDNAEDLGMLSVDQDWTVDNEEALNLVDAFVAVLNGMKVDNAGFNNPTGYTKILNNIYRKQGVTDFIELTELDSQTADMMLQDAQLIKDRLEFAKTLSAVNNGQKLKQQDKVAINKNYLVFNSFKRFVDVVPDDWVGKDELKGTLDSLSNLEQFSSENRNRLTKEERREVEYEMMQIEDSIYDFFQKNQETGGGYNADKLGSLLRVFAGTAGFFQKTGSLLTETSTALDDNSFIWWLASRAAVKSSDFYGAYRNAITEKIAPIASQELSTYLGVAAIANMNALNSFVDAYRNTVIIDFNNLDEKQREKYLNDFDGSGLSYSKDLLKYFSGHNVLPQYKNMIFIEGIPGSGKSKGVFSNIINIVKQIDPDILNGALYVHATEKAALEANSETGLNSTALERTKFLQYVSSEWKDTKDNIKTETYKEGNKDVSTTGRFLYDDSYEFQNGQLVNKWKINQYSDVPRIIFIDEITHYNQQELSMIEQFARENGSVVITAGDMDQDTQVAYAKVENKIADFTINRNNFIRSPKLGVSLRTLNKQMTSSIASTQAAIQQLNKGEKAELNFNYLDKDPNHSGLYGVKMHQADTDDLSDKDMEEIKATIKMMVDTSTGPIGYIYSDSNSKLYKYIESTYGKDKIIPFKDSDAQGLEGQYYIVENKRTFTESTPSEQEQKAYMRSLYTGISRAEQGALIIAPQSFGEITTINSKEDNRFQLEQITESQKKKAADARTALLEDLLWDFDPQQISILAPAKQTITRQTNTLGGLPPGAQNNTLPERINDGYTDRDKAQEALDQFITNLQSQGNIDNFIIGVLAPEEEIKSWGLEEKEENGITYWVPYIYSDYDDQYSLEWFNSHPLTLRGSNNIVQMYNIGDEIVIDNSGNDKNIRIIGITNNGNSITYEAQDIDDSSTFVIDQNDLVQAYKNPYAPPTLQQQNETPDTSLENGTLEEYEANIYEENATEEDEEVDFVNRVYTFNTMEMGVERDSNNKPVFKGPQEKFDERVDNAIGLMHLPLFANYTYDQLEDTIAYLHGLATTINDNTDLAKQLKLQLGLKGNIKVAWAIKSSAGRVNVNPSSPEYNRYDMDIDAEELLYMKSDNMTNAVIPMRKKLVLLVEQDGETIFELTTASLNSPLTKIQNTVGGQLVYPDEYNTFFTAMNKYNGNPEQLYLAVKETIDKHDGGSNQGLIDLFKMWLFTSNGVFYLNNDFNLANNETYGTEIIKRKGDYQLDSNLHYTKDFDTVEELAKDKRLKISSIFASRTGKVNNIEGVVKPGHSFVLVSDNPKFNSDQALVDQFMTQQDSNYQGKEEVSVYYVVPPSTTIEGWLRNQHNIYEKSTGNNGIEIFDIGNDFTAYRVLQSLLESGEFDKLQSSDSTADEVKQAIAQLDAIEQKWQATDIQFSDPQQQAQYETRKTVFGEKTARTHMAIVEQKRFLQTKPKWNKVTGPVTIEKTLAKQLASYLTNIVWFKSPGVPPQINFNQNALNAIQIACNNSKKPLTDIFYKPQYSKDEVGPFVKIQTRGKYSLGKSPIGSNANFRIGRKLDTRSFSVDSLAAEIHKFVNQFYFDKNVKNYKLKSSAQKNYERRYLRNQPKKQQLTVANVIENEYKQYFDKGILDKSVLMDSSLNRVQALFKLAQKYTEQRGNFGFVYNDKLYLTKLEDPNLLITDPRIDFDRLTPAVFSVVDLDDKYQRREIWFEVDSTGHVKEIKSRCTNVRTVDLNPVENSIELNDNEYTTVKDAYTEVYSKWRCGAPLILKKPTSTQELITRLITEKNTNASRLISDLTKIRKQFETNSNYAEAIKVIDKMLNYANSVATFNINTDDVVVLGDGRRFQIQSVNGTQIIGLELDANNQVSQLQHLFEESDIQNMKKEEPECAPVTWKLI